MITKDRKVLHHCSIQRSCSSGCLCSSINHCGSCCGARRKPKSLTAIVPVTQRYDPTRRVYELTNLNLNLALNINIRLVIKSSSFICQFWSQIGTVPGTRRLQAFCALCSNIGGFCSILRSLSLFFFFNCGMWTYPFFSPPFWVSSRERNYSSRHLSLPWLRTLRSGTYRNFEVKSTRGNVPSCNTKGQVLWVEQSFEKWKEVYLGFFFYYRGTGLCLC